MTHTIELSKWWRTASAKRAFERAERTKRERIETLKRRIAEHKAKLQNEVNGWEVKL